jgi:hypothetical protein
MKAITIKFLPNIVLVLGICILGILFGYGIVHQTKMAGLLFLFSLFAIAGFLLPETMAWLILLSVAISPQYFIRSGGILGIEISSLHKLAILGGITPFVLRFGLREILNAPIVAFTIVLGLTFTLSDMHPELSTLQPFKSFIGLTLGWIIFNINWNPKHADKYLLSISSMAIINLILGILLFIAGVRSFYYFEYTGAFRLAGSSIAAHLAMLAFVGVGVAMGEVGRGKKWYMWIALINFSILILTGTRGATFGAILIFLPYGFDQLKKILRGKTTLYFAILIIISVVITAYAVPALATRTLSTLRFSGQINTSGRIQAWTFFIEEGMANPLFGRGLGAGTVANQGQVHSAFSVPHNEFIRLFIDGGIIGTIIVVICFFMIFRRIIRQMEPGTRHYMTWLVLGFSLYSFFDNTLSTTQSLIPFCWHLGILYNRAGSASESNSARPFSSMMNPH